MRFNLTKPCSNCPFLKKGGVPLRLERIREIHRLVTGSSPLGEGVFPCHKTVTREHEDDEDASFEPLHDPKASYCAGAIIYSLKLESPNQMTRIALRLGSFDPDKLMKHESKVHDSLDAWIDADPIASKERKTRETEPIGDPCAVSNRGCEAPAGWISNGRVIEGTDAADYSCFECGQPVCGSCSQERDDGERICDDCSEDS